MLQHIRAKCHNDMIFCSSFGTSQDISDSTAQVGEGVLWDEKKIEREILKSSEEIFHYRFILMLFSLRECVNRYFQPKELPHLIIGNTHFLQLLPYTTVYFTNTCKSTKNPSFQKELSNFNGTIALIWKHTILYSLYTH